MKARTSSVWHLDPRDVVYHGGGTSIPRRRKIQQNRNDDFRDWTMTLVHIQTQTSVEGSIPPGHYSRAEMQKLKDELYGGLFRTLEARVAKALRISGR